ncbi:MAG: hypothetical protein RR500_04890 [Bacilli bacterium]
MSRRNTSHLPNTKEPIQTWYNYFRFLCVNIFQWENVPETMDIEYLENSLFESGKACVIDDIDYNDLGIENTEGLKVSPINVDYNNEGGVNLYGKPINIRVKSYGGLINKCIKVSDSIIIRLEDEILRDSIICLKYSKKIQEIEDIMSVNLNSQKTPIHISCTKDQELTVKRIYEKYNGNEPIIITDTDSNELANINVYKTDAPFLLDKFQDHKKNIENEFLTQKGINNLTSDKKERLLTGEVNSNNQLIHTTLEKHLQIRELFCTMINDKYKCDMSVKIRGIGSEEVDEKTDNGVGGSSEIL